MPQIAVVRTAVEIDVSAADYEGEFDSLWIGSDGDVKIQNWSGQDITYKNVPIGDFPYSGKIVYSSGTTASNIVANSFNS